MKILAATTALTLSLASSLAASESTRETKLRADATDAVGGVEILDNEHLEAGGGTLARGNDGPSKEEFPDLKQKLVLDQEERRKGGRTLYQR